MIRMKWNLFIFTSVAILFWSTASMAQNKVVVVPLGRTGLKIIEKEHLVSNAEF